AAFSLTVNGSNFNSASTIYFGKTPLTTAFLGATQLSATVPASAIAASGAVTITVQNGSASAVSNGITFNINGPTPTLSSLSPTFANQNAPGFMLTVNGGHFLTN